MYPYVYTSPNIHTQKILSVYITICIYICIYVHASVSSRHAHVRASRITSEGVRTCTPRAQDTPRAQATPQSLDVSILLCSACLCAASTSSNAQLSSSCPPVSPAYGRERSGGGGTRRGTGIGHMYLYVYDTCTCMYWSHVPVCI